MFVSDDAKVAELEKRVAQLENALLRVVQSTSYEAFGLVTFQKATIKFVLDELAGKNGT